MKIRIGLLGYGNLSRGVESAVTSSSDLELSAIFTRREGIKAHSDVPVLPVKDILSYKNKIDVLILGGGSATDLPVQTPKYVEFFNVVDSFDTHAKIKEHFANVDRVAKASGKVGIISVGWDPGLFSLIRGFSSAVLPDGSNYTFWGRGVSQGHSDAIRRIEGVIDARQYTVPIESAIKRVRSGESPVFTAREMHKRECFVVVKESADKSRIAKEIKSMPNYFADYDTVVHFISQDELEKHHSKLPHGGFVLRSGVTGFDKENKHIIEYSLNLDSNPEFTGSVLTAYARAAYRLYNRGVFGCKTVFDIPTSTLVPDEEELLKLL